jgi:hypothetical protein
MIKAVKEIKAVAAEKGISALGINAGYGLNYRELNLVKFNGEYMVECVGQFGIKLGKTLAEVRANIAKI